MYKKNELFKGRGEFFGTLKDFKNRDLTFPHGLLAEIPKVNSDDEEVDENNTENSFFRNVSSIAEEDLQPSLESVSRKSLLKYAHRASQRDKSSFKPFYSPSSRIGVSFSFYFVQIQQVIEFEVCFTTLNIIRDLDNFPCSTKIVEFFRES